MSSTISAESYGKFVAALQEVGLDISHLHHDHSFSRTQVVGETIGVALDFEKPFNLANPASRALLSLAQGIENGSLIERARKAAGVEVFGTGIQLLNGIAAYLQQEYRNKKDATARTVVAFADTLQDIAGLDEQDRLVAGALQTARGNAAATPLQPFYQALSTHARMSALALAFER